MKNSLYILLLVSLMFIGCNPFSKTENNSVRNTSQTPASSTANTTNSTTNTSNSTVSSTPTSSPTTSPATTGQYTERNYVGRWLSTEMRYRYIIEFKEGGTGTIILNEGLGDEKRQDFSWKVERNDAVFTVKPPMVEFEGMQSLTVTASLMEDGKKLKTDYSPVFRSKGRAIFEKM